MKYILISTVTILLTKDFGHFLLPQLFTSFAVQVSLAVLFAILVPIGFSKSLVLYLSERNNSVKKIGDTVVYLLIFFATLLAPVTTMHIKNSFILTNKYLPDHTSSMLEAPVNITQEEGRVFAARSIFKEYGKKVPYKLETGGYSIFQPTEKDIADYDKRKKQKAKRRNGAIVL